MKAAARQMKIRQMVDSQEFVDFQTLCRKLASSESSIRRDLIALERGGQLKRVYGGAMAAQPSTTHILDFAWQSKRMHEEKQRIAELATHLIEDGQTVILDGGSTVVEFARQLHDRPLHVLTNSLPIAEIFADSHKIEVTLTGGYLYPRMRAMVGPLCEQMLSTVTADVLVMSIGGVTADGFSNNNTLVVGPERKMIEVSRKVIVLSDHTKFGRSAMIPVAPLEVIDVVVSDTGLEPVHRDMLQNHGVEVYLA